MDGLPAQRLLRVRADPAGLVGDEVAGRQPQLEEQVEDLLELAGLVPAEAELRRHQVPGGPLHHVPARVGDLGQSGPGRRKGSACGPPSAGVPGG
jgi:hypothetical protein